MWGQDGAESIKAGAARVGAVQTVLLRMGAMADHMPPLQSSGTQQGRAFQAFLAGIASLQTLADQAGEIGGIVGDTAEAA